MSPSRPALSKTKIVGNWKMNGSRKALSIIPALEARLAASPAVEVGLAPPAAYLSEASALARRVQVGVQDIHAAREGAYTGQISAVIAADAGARFALVGHSEARAAQNLSNADVAARAEAAQDAGLSVILCLGESATVRAAGQARAWVREQLLACLPMQPDGLSIAYEPIWAIGSGRAAALDEIAEMHSLIRQACDETFGAASAVAILYGGSVTPANAAAILGCDAVDGLLVGGASLELASFSALVSIAAKARAPL